MFICRKILQLETALQDQSTDQLEVFGRRLRAAAEDRGLSQAEIGRALKVKPGRVGNWFQGRNLPRGKVFIELSRLLNLPIDRLVSEEQLADSMAVDSVRSTESAEEAKALHGEIGDLMARLLAAAGTDPVRLSWVLGQLHVHLPIPLHWATGVKPSPGEHPAVIRAEEEGRRSGRKKLRQYLRHGVPAPGDTKGPAASVG
jgi:transcriptional regulator with XRE-family HTH domain